MFLQNPSALFRYNLGTGVKQTLLFRESASPGSLVMSNLFTNMLFAFDEVFMAGYYQDSSSVHNHYVLSIDANNSSLSSVLYRRKIDLTGCNTIQSGPWIPTSYIAEYLGVSTHDCFSTYTMLIHKVHTTSFDVPQRIDLGVDYY